VNHNFCLTQLCFAVTMTSDGSTVSYARYQWKYTWGY